MYSVLFSKNSLKMILFKKKMYSLDELLDIVKVLLLLVFNDWMQMFCPFKKHKIMQSAIIKYWFIT